MLSDSQINEAKNRAPLQLNGHFEHNDCIRMAYEWLDAQVKTKTQRKTFNPIKHIIEKWSGRYVSQSDVEVAAWLHPDIIGTYPNFNISSRLTFPSVFRLSGIGEAGKHNPIGAHYNADTYSANEGPLDGLESFEKTIQKVLGWFFENFQDPANRLPYIGHEGGYQYIHGGPYDARDEISNEFGNYIPEEVLEAAINRVQKDGTVFWDTTEDNFDWLDEPEPPSGLDGESPFGKAKPRQMPSRETLDAPAQSPGPQWTITNKRITPKSEPARSDPISVLLHTELRAAARSAQNGCSTLGNKYPELWRVLNEYTILIDVEPDSVVEVSLFATGIDLTTRYELARDATKAKDPEYAELNQGELALLTKLVQLHAPYIQNTEIGAYLTELSLREYRTPDQERDLSNAVIEAADAMLEYSDVIDVTAITQIRDFAAIGDEDPSAHKRRAFSYSSIRNFVTVVGVASITFVTPPVIGGLLGGVPGAILGTVTSTAISTVLMPIIRKT